VDGPLHSFEDISWATDLNISFDDTYVAQALPFAFPFYGNEYNSVFVTSNGLLTFSEGGSYSFGNDALPSAGAPNNMICAFWDDLDPEEGGTVRYYHDPTATGRSSSGTVWPTTATTSPTTM
jgi:hypothetical protein